MDRPATASPASARDVILEIVRNMKEGLEPLHYSILPPALYLVYLHPDDMERLRAIVPRIVDEARRALDEEVERLKPRVAGGAAETGAARGGEGLGAGGRLADPHTGEHGGGRRAGRHRDPLGAGAAGEDGAVGRLDDQAHRHAQAGGDGEHLADVPAAPAAAPAAARASADASGGASALVHPAPTQATVQSPPPAPGPTQATVQSPPRTPAFAAPPAPPPSPAPTPAPAPHPPPRPIALSRSSTTRTRAGGRRSL